MKLILEEILKQETKFYENSDFKILQVYSKDQISKYLPDENFSTQRHFEEGSFIIVLFKHSNPNSKFRKILIFIPHRIQAMGPEWFDSNGKHLDVSEVSMLKQLYPNLNKINQINSLYHLEPAIESLAEKIVQNPTIVLNFSTKKIPFVKLKYSNPTVKNKNILLGLRIYKDDEKIDEFLVLLKFFYEVSAYKIVVNVKNDEFDGNLNLYYIDQNNFMQEMSRRILTLLRKNLYFYNKLFGYKTWVRVNSYTFKKNEGMIKKLVEYLDSNPENPTKYSFLEHIGYLRSRIVGAKKEYSRQNTHEFLPAGHWRGQYSDFFNAASAAGIIKVSKKGGLGILSKGPNFEEFKKGNLKPIF